MSMKLLYPVIDDLDILTIITPDASVEKITAHPFTSIAAFTLDEVRKFLAEGILPAKTEENHELHTRLEYVEKNSDSIRSYCNSFPEVIREGILGFCEIRSLGAIQEHTSLGDVIELFELEEFHNTHIWVKPPNQDEYLAIMDVCDLQNVENMVEISHVLGMEKSVIRLPEASSCVLIKTRYAGNRSRLVGLEIVEWSS